MKTLLFDFDGTLADSYDIVIRCANLLSKKYGYPRITNPEALRDRTLKQAVKEDLHIRRYMLPFFARSMQSCLRQHSAEIKLYPKLLPVLQQLSKQFHLAILSSNRKKIIQDTLVKEQVTLFTNISSDSSLFGKDKAIKKFIRKHWLHTDDVIYIGDELRDIEACKKIWVKIIAVSWGFNNKEALQKYNPDYLVDTPQELLEITKTF